MAANLSIFSCDIRSVDGLFSLNDLHKAAGGEKRHVPAQFLRPKQTQDLIEEINRYANKHNAITVKQGGCDQGTWVCKELVYAYAMWISAKFHLEVIRAFDRMATGAATGPINDDQFTALSRLIQNKVKCLAPCHRRSATSRIWTQIHIGYNVKSGRDIPTDQYDSVRGFIGGYAIEGEYIPAQQLKLEEKPANHDYSHLNLSGKHTLSDAMTLMSELKTVIPAYLGGLVQELDKTLVVSWTQSDEALHRLEALNRRMTEAAGMIRQQRGVMN